VARVSHISVWDVPRPSGSFQLGPLCMTRLTRLSALSGMVLISVAIAFGPLSIFDHILPNEHSDIWGSGRIAQR
jgi:hypothetical protein